uniref:Uncharacterized protein n=1 Tax=Plectus sambesii TaxID=2011161 RepID=A0A914WR20_9BILA
MSANQQETMREKGVGPLMVLSHMKATEDARLVVRAGRSTTTAAMGGCGGQAERPHERPRLANTRGEGQGCDVALGMESGRIPDAYISASSSFDDESVGPASARFPVVLGIWRLLRHDGWPASTCLDPAELGQVVDAAVSEPLISGQSVLVTVVIYS